MAKEERRTYWKQIVDEQIASGLSAPVFCQEHNPNYPNLNDD
jgi:hypothetical protein